MPWHLKAVVETVPVVDSFLGLVLEFDDVQEMVKEQHLQRDIYNNNTPHQKCNPVATVR